MRQRFLVVTIIAPSVWRFLSLPAVFSALLLSAGPPVPMIPDACCGGSPIMSEAAWLPFSVCRLDASCGAGEDRVVEVRLLRVLAEIRDELDLVFHPPPEVGRGHDCLDLAAVIELAVVDNH